MSKNLDLFNQQTAEIFAVLWDNFPVPQVITYEKFNAALPDDYFNQLNSPEMKAPYSARTVISRIPSCLAVKCRTPEGI
ncbi:hypothetical protein U4O40_17010 [Klebsiella pneumoniae]|nr:hypothetical protein [Klebsiella pneumoniae]